jgi:peptidoglycan/LPS O-acetylase OafA/YrhL
LAGLVNLAAYRYRLFQIKVKSIPMRSIPNLLRGQYGQTDFVTGMRAWAASLVVLVHSGGGGLGDLGEIGKSYASYGRVGVYIFYTISGFAIAAALQRSRSFPGFIAQRFFRIAPLYYFWILIVFLVPALHQDYWMQYFHAKLDFYNIAMHLAFLSGWDRVIANPLLGVEWSVSVEAFWYCVLPALVFLVHRLTGGVVTALSIGLYVLLSQYGARIFGGEDWALSVQWLPLTYAASFTLGIWAHDSREKIVDRFRPTILAAGLLLFALYPVLPARLAAIFVSEFIFVSLATFLLLLGGSKGSVLSRALFENRVAQHVGVVSYGVYLCHVSLLVLFTRLGLPMLEWPLLRFALAWGLAVLVSTILHYLIERPGIRLGHVLTNPTKGVPAPVSAP